jgi:hypothetical protein
MSEFTILDALGDRQLFGRQFKNLDTWRNWIVFLKAVFCLPMDLDELEAFKGFTGREHPPERMPAEVYAIVGRRGGKSFMAAVLACYLALFHDWRPYLAAGETAWVMVIATDRNQARNILGYIKGILNSSKILGQEVESDLAWEISLRNQVGIKIGTCSYRALRGYTVVAAICDELAYFRAEGANPDREILTALRPSLATIPGGMIFGISSPYSKNGVLYEAYRDKWGRDDEEIFVWQGSTRDMNPTIKERVIERAFRADAAAAESEWNANFRSDLESYLTAEAIESVIMPGRIRLPRAYRGFYEAFADPSGGRRDSFTLAVAHRDPSGRVILDALEERKPPFAPESVVADYALILRGYGIEKVTGDRYGGEWPAAAFRKHGIRYLPSDKDKSAIYLEFLPLVMQNRVELLDNARLREQLRSLERRARAGGKDSVDHFPNAHDDVANAVAGVCVSCGLRRGTVISTLGSGSQLQWLTDPFDPAMPYPSSLEGMAADEIRAWTTRLEEDLARTRAEVSHVL